MAAYTATQSGNWSDAATWGGSGPPGDGDTATVGAFTVTVDVDTTVGTSPNDTTTNVVNKSSATGSLIVGAGVTFTVKGNIGGVNTSVFTMQPGSAVVFDASASGGTPTYRFNNGGFQAFDFNGSSGSRCAVRAITGRYCSLNVAVTSITATFTDFLRCSTLINVTSGDVTFADCTFDDCGRLSLSNSGTTVSCTVARNAFSNGQHANDDVVLTYSGTFTSGTRLFERNVLSKALTYNSVLFTCQNNYLGGGVDGVAGSYYRRFSGNLVYGTRANGQVVQSAATSRNCFLAPSTGSGNPHFVEAKASSADVAFDQNVFESNAPDVVDMGDCILIVGTGISAGRKVVARNNVVVPNSAAASAVSSGTMLTAFSAGADTVTEWYRNSCNINNFQTTGKRGAFATSEGGDGPAGQVAALKSNVVYGSSSGQGYLGERTAGTLQDGITAAGADYNWLHNTSAGSDGRGYQATNTGNTMWAAGNAAAAGVDDNQGSGDPQFVDATRNTRTWAVDRGYGTTTADALTALQADPTRTADLIDYVFAGFKPSNAAMRTAAHDGMCVGAANYHDVTRTGVGISKVRAFLAA